MNDERCGFRNGLTGSADATVIGEGGAVMAIQGIYVDEYREDV